MAVTTAKPSTALGAEAQQILARPPRGLWADAWIRLRRNKASMASLIFIIALALTAIFAPLIAPHNPLAQDTTNSFRQAAWIQTGGKDTGTWVYPLGTDNLGRDVFSRLIYGARVSLTVGLVPMFIVVTVGMFFGLVAGYTGGMTDNLIMRVIDILIAFPDLLLFILATATLRDTPLGRTWNGLLLLFLVLSLLGWTGVARLVRGEVLSVMNQPYIEAANSTGVRTGRMITRHILPNSFVPIVVASTLGVANAMLSDAALSFLGLGIQPPTPSWGNMLNAAQSLQVLVNEPWVWIGPGLAIALTVLSINFLGDGLRDALDPHL